MVRRILASPLRRARCRSPDQLLPALLRVLDCPVARIKIGCMEMLRFLLDKEARYLESPSSGPPNMICSLSSPCLFVTRCEEHRE